MATMTALSTVTVGAGGASTIQFTNIPQTYTDLQIVVSARSNTANTGDYLLLYFNGSTSNVSSKTLGAYGPSTTFSGTEATYFINILPAANATANTFGNNSIYIPNYVSSDYKSGSIEGGFENDSSSSWFLFMTNGLWSNTSPITSVTLDLLDGSFVQYSSATLYGVFRGPETLPSTPTIGTATAGDASASITFTATSATDVDASYTAISTPGSITGTGTSSPVTVSGLTNGTAYTFQVRANNPGGSSDYSSASNSVTPFAPAWEYIATVSPTSTNLITFSSIPEGYSALKIIGQSNTVGDSILYTRMNTVGGAGYAEYGYYGSASSTLSTAGGGTSSSVIRRYASNSTSSSENAPVMGTYFNANGTSGTKQVQITSGYSSPTNLAFTISQGSLSSLNAKISSISLGTGNGPGATNYTANARFTLYGLKVS